MEALLAQFSSLADEAMEDKNFDPSRIERLMKRFEAEAERSWSAADVEIRKAAGEAAAELLEAERSLISLLGAGTDDFRRTEGGVRRGHKSKPSSVVLVVKAMKKAALAPTVVTKKPAKDVVVRV